MLHTMSSLGIGPYNCTSVIFMSKASVTVCDLYRNCFVHSLCGVLLCTLYFDAVCCIYIFVILHSIFDVVVYTCIMPSLSVVYPFPFIGWHGVFGSYISSIHAALPSDVCDTNLVIIHNHAAT